MTRAITFGLACLALGFFIRSAALQQAAAEPPTQKDWEEFFDAVGDLEATVAGAEALVSGDHNDWRWDECRFQSLNHPLWTAREERLTAQCAVEKWSVPGGLSEFLSIGQCESGWNRWASNAGRYLGLFQHAASAYVSRIRAYTPPSWDRALSERWPNSRGQIVMSARMMHANGTGAWSCA